jgi:muramoyltetrapeptide carboxypeptidase LdcA involved in peptidoglycan recycling
MEGRLTTGSTEYFTQWRNAGLLQQVAGIGMGRFN